MISRKDKVMAFMKGMARVLDTKPSNVHIGSMADDARALRSDWDHVGGYIRKATLIERFANYDGKLEVEEVWPDENMGHEEF